MQNLDISNHNSQAIALAVEYKLSIIPLNVDKKPYFSWKKYQTEIASERELIMWQKQHKPAAWAVITGAISSLVILDFDGEQGRKTMESLGLQPHVRTGSGGYHVYFEHPGWHVPTLNSKSKRELGERWAGLDIRADGGYAAFAGSNSNGAYTWLRDFVPERLDILPQNLRSFLGLLQAPTENQGDPTQQKITPIAEVALSSQWGLDRIGSLGGRSNAAFALACQLRDNKLSQPEAENIMRDFARRAPTTNAHGAYEPFSERESLSALEQALTRGARDPWQAKSQGRKNIDISANIDNGIDEAKAKKPTALELLTEIASQAKFINTPAGDFFARVPVNSHHEMVSISERGSGFRRWLIYCFDKQHGYIPNSEALTQIMERVKARAQYEGVLAKVHTRIAEKDGRVYLDMGNEKWECIEIASDGWRIISDPPVFFRRPNGLKPLPRPQPGGCLNDLKQIINVKTDKDFILIIGWLLGTLHPHGPYAVLNLNGERGSGKSKAEIYLRSMIDPNEAPARNAPKDEREAAIAAQNNMVIALDNLSSVPLWLSDVLCRIATGNGFSTRELYEDDIEKIFSAKRPIILNGIEDGIISQGDLLSRTILVTLEPPAKYIAEEEIDQRFQELHPQLLGSLLDAACTALRERRNVQFENAPRMVDFAQWVTAAEPALQWEPGTFMKAFTENQENSTSIVTESSPTATAIVQFMALEAQKDGWMGLTSELHEELKKCDVYSTSKKAPKDPTRLSGQIKRIAASLRMQGLEVQQPGRTERGSCVIIRHISPKKVSSSNVAKHVANVAKPPSDVANFSLATAQFDADFERNQSNINSSTVAAVASYAQLSTSSFPSESGKKEEKKREGEQEKEGIDNIEIVATAATGATVPHPYNPIQVAPQPQQYEEIF